MRRMEIRCCCNPAKLLGTVDVPDTMRRTVRWAIADGEILELPIAPITMPDGHGHFMSYAAIKSMDTPLWKLKCIPSFREVNRGQE